MNCILCSFFSLSLCRMGDRVQETEGKTLRKQLVDAVRSIQWSYAIFWSPSMQPGVLEWGEGYYNGDIKTRKTISAMELDSDQIGCQRSVQLKELYEFLISGYSEARRPSASLSPEDLTNAEWYYLLCMSFVFPTGQGLPGRCLAEGQPVWLCNAHCADKGVFCRSLLAKSAGIKTVVCFPFSRGVIELGVTELVQEDLDLIQQVRTAFLEMSCLIVSWSPNALVQFSAEVSLADLPPLTQVEDMGLVSPSASSNGFGPIPPAKNALLVEGYNGKVSQAQSWQLIDEDKSYGAHTSMTSSNCVSETFASRKIVPPSPQKTKITNNGLQGWNQGNITQDPLTKDLHYQNTHSILFKTSHPLTLGSSSITLEKGSSFTGWKTGGKKVAEFTGVPQKMLKRVLFFEVPRMDTGHSPPHQSKEDSTRKELYKGSVEPNKNYVLVERKRREKVNERFSVLKSLIPARTKVSILDDTIDYLKDLERRVEELESCQVLGEYVMKNKRGPQDMEERTSDNYRDDVYDGSKKRKIPAFNEGAQECILLSAKERSIHSFVTVHAVEEDIFIDIKCPWRESLLVEIMDAMGNLHLESHSIQSSTSNDILCLKMKSRVKGSSSLSVEMITQTLQTILNSC